MCRRRLNKAVSTFSITRDHFSGELKLDRSKELFKASVNQVEIETFTYCNRTCWFCPNSRIDRRSENRYMDEGLYLRILSELAAIEYNQVITYSRYNEPLADRIILTRLRQARQILPKACLSTHTNGDYLNGKYLDELKESGLKRLRVQVYLGNKEPFDDRRILIRMEQRLKNLGLPYQMIGAERGIRYMAQVDHKGMEVTFDARNFAAIGVDRGQTINLPQTYQRRSPCLIVFQHLYVDYDGTVVPCCNIRSDEPGHAPFLIDRLGENRSIYQAYAGNSLAAWRRALIGFGPKNKPCNSCSYECLEETPQTAEQFATIARQFGLN
jgi:MoaA/NifB/PqqE/SkfB family radical SAM enzyme